MTTITDLKFQPNPSQENSIIVSAVLSLESPVHTMSYENKNTNPIYIFCGDREFYPKFGKIAGNHPVSGGIVYICDQKGTTVCIMPNSRTKNRCGTIPITLEDIIAFGEFNIPDTKIDPSAVYYFELTNYAAFNMLSTDQLRSKLINEDLFGFARKYHNLNINVMVSSNVAKFIEKFHNDSKPENLNIVTNSTEFDIYGRSGPTSIVNIVCELVFGKIIRRSAATQCELFFKLGDEIVTPIFSSESDDKKISALLKTVSIQYTGQGECRIIVLLNSTSFGRTDAEGKLIPLRIVNEDESQVYYSGDYSENFDFASIGCSDLIRNLRLYKGITNSNPRAVPTFITDNIRELMGVRFYTAPDITAIESEQRVIASHLASINRKFVVKICQKLSEFWTEGVNDTMNKRKAIQGPFGLGTEEEDTIGGLGIRGIPGFGLGPQIMCPLDRNSHSISACATNHSAIGRSISDLTSNPMFDPDE